MWTSASDSDRLPFAFRTAADIRHDPFNDTALARAADDSRHFPAQTGAGTVRLEQSRGHLPAARLTQACRSHSRRGAVALAPPWRWWWVDLATTRHPRGGTMPHGTPARRGSVTGHSQRLAGPSPGVPTCHLDTAWRRQGSLSSSGDTSRHCDPPVRSCHDPVGLLHYPGIGLGRYSPLGLNVVVLDERTTARFVRRHVDTRMAAVRPLYTALQSRAAQELILFLFLGGVIIYLHWLPAARETIFIGREPGRVTLDGFYGRETNPAFSFRWAKPDASLTVPVQSADAYRVTLALQDSPDVWPPRVVQVMVNGAPLGAVQLDTVMRTYTFRYNRRAGRPDENIAQPLTIGLQTEAFTPGGDPRALGALVAGVEIEPLRPPRAWRLRFLTAQLTLLTVAFAALRLVAGASTRPGITRARRFLPIGFAALAIGLLATTKVVPDLPPTQPVLLLAALLIPLLLPLPAALGHHWQLPGTRRRAVLAPERLWWPAFMSVVLVTWSAIPATFGALGDADSLRVFVAAIVGGILVLRHAPLQRPRALVTAYAVPTIAVTIWWHVIVGPRLAGQPELLLADRTAIGLVPWILGVFAAGHCLLLAIAPVQHRRALLLGDLASSLLLLGMPAVALFSLHRGYSPVERELNVSWPGGLLIAVIAVKTAIAAVALVRAAPAYRSERRLALALLVLFVAAYWSLVPWRTTAMGASGDEPGYLAAALSLAEDRDLELTNNGYAPRMVALTRFPVDAWGNEISEAGRDRLALVTAQEPATRHLLPAVGGPGLHGRIAVISLEREPVEVTIRFRRADEPMDTAVERRTIARATSVLVAPPPGDGWMGAIIEATRPVYAAVRLSAEPGGIDVQDSYAPPAATVKPCTPLALSGASWETVLLVSNTAGNATAVTVTRRDGEGRPDLVRQVSVPANGLAAVPLPVSGSGGLTASVCADARDPIATTLIARQPGAGLLAAPGLRAAAGHFAAPPAPFQRLVSGTVSVVLHNPGEMTAAAVMPGSNTTITIPPHGTVAQPLPVAAGYTTERLVQLRSDAPVVVVYLLRYGEHLAAYVPRPAGEQAVLPAIVGKQKYYVDTRVILGNQQADPVELTARLYDSGGKLRDLRRRTLCAGCIETLRLDFTDEQGRVASGEGAIVVDANRPVVVAGSQLELRTAGNHHAWGLGALAAPGARVAGWQGALLTVATMAALLLVQLYGLIRDAGIGRRTALVTVIVLGLSSPLATFAVQLYPEIPATFFLILALRLTLAASPPRGWRLGALAACLIAIPLFHTRLVPLVIILTASLFWHSGIKTALRRRATLARAIAALSLSTAFFLVWWFAGRYLPPVLALSSRLSGDYLERYFSASFLGHYLAGVLLDRATGLVPAAPLLLLVGGGLVIILRHAPRYGIWISALTGVQLLVVGLRADGWEAWGPPGRYLYPVAPLLGLGVAAAWATWSPRWLRLIGALLAGWGLLAAFVFSWVPLAAYYYTGDRKWFGDPLARDWFGGNPLAVFPTILAGMPFDPRVVVPWVVLFAVFTLAGLPWASLRRASHPIALPGAENRS